MDVVMSASEMPSNSRSMSASDITLTPHFPGFPQRQRMIGIAPHQRRQIERDAQAGAAGREQRLVAFVGLGRCAESGELPHRPQLAAIAGGMDAAGVGKLPGIIEVARVGHAFDILGGVEPLDGAARYRGERGGALGRLLQRGLQVSRSQRARVKVSAAVFITRHYRIISRFVTRRPIRRFGLAAFAAHRHLDDELAGGEAGERELGLEVPRLPPGSNCGLHDQIGYLLPGSRLSSCATAGCSSRRRVGGHANQQSVRCG